MDIGELSDAAQRGISDAVQHFEANRHRFGIVANNLVDCFSMDPVLAQWIHFIKYRVKGQRSLTDKLQRLVREDPSAPIDASNIFDRVTDLAGVRIIHLHNDQLADLHPRVLQILDQNQYAQLSDPVAHCWDDEYEALFHNIGLRTKRVDSMYTTVHYDVQASQNPPITCELQVRSLADEIWGEVSHRVNYPTESPSEACRDQLKVLARLTSGCGRLVDSIFKTHSNAVGAERP